MLMLRLPGIPLHFSSVSFYKTAPSLAPGISSALMIAGKQSPNMNRMVPVMRTHTPQHINLDDLFIFYLFMIRSFLQFYYQISLFQNHKFLIASWGFGVLG